MWVELGGESEPVPVLTNEAKNEIATMFMCRHWAVDKIWKRAKSNKQKIGHYVAHSLKSQVGRGRKATTDYLLSDYLTTGGTPDSSSSNEDSVNFSILPLH